MSEEIITSEKPKIDPSALVVNDSSEFSMLLDTARFNQGWRIATAFSQSKLVPSHFQGDIPSVFIVLQMAMRLEVDPFMFLQNTFVVHGRPGMEAKLQIALANQRGPFTGPIQWDIKRDAAGKVVSAQAYATHKITKEICRGPVIDWTLVQAEGWDKDKPMKSGGYIISKWKTMPELMFRYRAASWFIKLFCPETVMGIPAADELEDEPEIEMVPQANGLFHAEPSADPGAEKEPTVEERFLYAINGVGFDPQAVNDYIEKVRGKHSAETIKDMALKNFPEFCASFKDRDKPKRGRPAKTADKAPDGPTATTTEETKPDAQGQQEAPPEVTQGPREGDTVAKVLELAKGSLSDQDAAEKMYYRIRDHVTPHELDEMNKAFMQ